MRLFFITLSFILNSALLSVAYLPSRISRSAHKSSLYATKDEERKAEIQRKINELKKAGKISPRNNDPVGEQSTESIENLTGVDRLRTQREQLKKKESVVDQYSMQLQERLGRKAKYLGIDGAKKKTEKRQGQIGSFDGKERDDDYDIMSPELFEDDVSEEEDDEEDLDEQAMVQLVAEKLRKKQAEQRAKEEELQKAKLEEVREKLQRERQESVGNNATRTTGVGGAYIRNETAANETYRPSRGSWGYFERPKDISKAFGGGRQIGAGYMKEEDKEASLEKARQRMKEYRIKMGIDVESEEKHANEIDQALKIAKVAMERGIYNTAVSALEKVTRWCSSNSQVGSKVFLELAMAYEAVGRKDEARQIYQKLSTCRLEDIKRNAKRLLYGLESYEFMKSDAQLSSFDRKKIRTTFIDVTGLDTFAQQFDNAYNTAYVDLSSRDYKKLTENVVRSVREARQILLAAVDSGIVQRGKIVQALRSVSRRFDEAMRLEKEQRELAEKPVAIMDGKPIMPSLSDRDRSNEDFKLASSEKMIKNLSGEWRLQLIADKVGDGVKFYNKTLSWLELDTETMKFSSQVPVGFLSVSENGGLDFDEEKRVLRRNDIQSSTGGILAGLLGGQDGATNSRVAQQVMTVDSVIMVTKCAETLRWQDEDKCFFAVWRRVEEGTFSSES